MTDGKHVGISTWRYIDRMADACQAGRQGGAAACEHAIHPPLGRPPLVQLKHLFIPSPPQAVGNAFALVKVPQCGMRNAECGMRDEGCGMRNGTPSPVDDEGSSASLKRSCVVMSLIVGPDVMAQRIGDAFPMNDTPTRLESRFLFLLSSRYRCHPASLPGTSKLNSP